MRLILARPTLGSDVGCASGKNIDCAYRKARVRFACCARECSSGSSAGGAGNTARQQHQLRPGKERM
jgi:hypothetical protein